MADPEDRPDRGRKLAHASAQGRAREFPANEARGLGLAGSKQPQHVAPRPRSWLERLPKRLEPVLPEQELKVHGAGQVFLAPLGLVALASEGVLAAAEVEAERLSDGPAKEGGTRVDLELDSRKFTGLGLRDEERAQADD